MEIRQLKWDSDFLGFPVFSVHTTCREFDGKKMRELLVAEGARLTYLFLDEDSCRDQVEQFGGVLYDTKVTFRRHLDTIEGGNAEEVDQQPNSETYASLRSLALLSGHHSRFYLDKRLDGRYEELYGLWLDNSLNKQVADKVYVDRREGMPVGFVTGYIRDGLGWIGLIATDAGHQGKGIGRNLMNSVQDYFISCGVKEAAVVTQEANEQACFFYEKCGYHLHKKEFVYHLWL
jgi:dTDP-4-amino-4,6-dideoxy-D-galactose acyltransferase